MKRRFSTYESYDLQISVEACIDSALYLNNFDPLVEFNYDPLSYLYTNRINAFHLLLIKCSTKNIKKLPNDYEQRSLDIFRWIKSSLSIEENNKLFSESGLADSSMLMGAIYTGSKIIFDEVIKTLQEAQYQQSLKVNLGRFNNLGCGVLTNSLNCGSEHIFDAVLKLFQQPIYASLFKKQLENITQDGFSVLQLAINSGSMLIFDEVLKLLKKPEHESLLKMQLENITKDGFDVLQMAIRSSSELIFDEILKLLKKPEHESLLKMQLENSTKDDFGVLLTAIKSGSSHIFDALLMVLKEPGHESLLKMQLENITKDGFGVLLAAIKSGIVPIFNAVMMLLKEPGHESLLKMQLENIRKDGIGVLQIATKSSSAHIFDAVLILLKKPENERLLKMQLESITQHGFSLLQLAIKSGSTHIFDEILTLLKKPENEMLLKMQLENITKEGFGLLHDGIRSGSVDILSRILSLLTQEQHRSCLKNNLLNVTKHKHSPFDSMITQLYDTNVDSIIYLYETYLEKHLWQEFIQSHLSKRYRLFDSILESPYGSIAKIKLLIAAFFRAFDRENAIELLKNHIRVMKFTLHQIEYDVNTLIMENLEYRLPSAIDLINDYINNFDQTKDASFIVRDYCLGIHDYRQDVRGRTLLWCLAVSASYGHTQPFIQVWQKLHTSFDINDITRRGGSAQKGDSVLWLLLYACKNNTNQIELLEIIKQIWLKFPQAFDLNYKPENSSKTLKDLLITLGEVGQDILSKLMPRTEKESSLQSITIANPQPVRVIAGIGDKYLFGAQPTLPKAISAKTAEKAEEHMEVVQHIAECRFIHCSEQNRQANLPYVQIEKPNFRATFYGLNNLDILKGKMMTFVCAGRRRKRISACGKP